MNLDKWSIELMGRLVKTLRSGEMAIPVAGSPLRAIVWKPTENIEQAFEFAEWARKNSNTLFFVDSRFVFNNDSEKRWLVSALPGQNRWCTFDNLAITIMEALHEAIEGTSPEKASQAG